MATRARTIAVKGREGVTELAAAGDALGLGPGIGLDEETGAATRALTAEVTKPMAIDADGLSALAGHLDVLHSAPAARCLTPHPGEMARLLGGSVADVQRDRLETVRQFATRHRVHVVLKGAWSAIGDPDGRVLVNPTGKPVMACCVPGEVLTGALGALLSRGVHPVD